MASVQIREYGKDDRNFVVHCLTESQRTISSLDDMGICKLRNGYGSRMANLILAEIRSGRAAIYIAEINQVRVGMVSAAVHTPSIAEVIESGNMKIGVVTELFVEPDFRRKGVAKKLIRSAELFLKGIGCKILSIHVISANKAAINLYRKQGYSEYEIVLDKRA